MRRRGSGFPAGLGPQHSRKYEADPAERPGFDITVRWDFWPIREPGLAIVFFHARGRRGEDIFDLAPRTGPFDEMLVGDEKWKARGLLLLVDPSEKTRRSFCPVKSAFTHSATVKFDELAAAEPLLR